MKLRVKGQIFPKVWDIASNVKKFREERTIVNLGSGTIAINVYEVTLSGGTKKEGIYFVSSSLILHSD